MRNWLARGAAKVWYRIGHGRAAAGRNDEAIAAFERAVAADAAYIPGRIALADRLSAKGENGRALSELATVIAQDPTDLHAHLTKGQIEAASGRLTDAVQTLERCRALAPDQGEVWALLADCYFNGASDGFIKAEPIYRGALLRPPASFRNYRGLGECLARRKQLDEAKAAHDSWFRQWLDDPASEAPRRRQGEAHARGRPALMLVAMQKSASEFIRENLLRALDVPEIHVSIGTVPRDRIIPSAVRQLARGSALARSHMDGSDLPALLANGISRFVLHVRDPRQVTVSWAHMMRRVSDDEFRYAAYMYDPSVPDEFRAWDLSRQLEWAALNYLPGQIGWLESWAAALDAAPKATIKVTRYEDFSADQRGFFRELAAFYGFGDIALPQSSEQSAAAMRNFRSGDRQEWRGVLRPEALQPFASRLRPLAERFGWEENSSR